MSKPTNTAGTGRLKRRNLLNNIRLSEVERKAESHRNKTVEASIEAIEIATYYSNNPKDILKLLCDVEGQSAEFLQAFVQVDILSTIEKHIDDAESTSLLFQLTDVFASNKIHRLYAFNSGAFQLAIESLHHHRTQEYEVLTHALELVLNTIDEAPELAVIASQKVTPTLLSTLLDAFKGDLSFESVLVGVWLTMLNVRPQEFLESVMEHMELFISYLRSDTTQPAAIHLMSNVMGMVTVVVAKNLMNAALCEEILRMLDPDQLVAALLNPGLQFMHAQVLNVLVNFTSLETGDWIAKYLVDLGLDKYLSTASDRLSLMLLNNLMIAYVPLINHFAKLPNFIHHIVHVGNIGTADMLYEVIGIIFQMSGCSIPAVADSLALTSINKLFADALCQQNLDLHYNTMSTISEFIDSEAQRLDLPAAHKDHLEVSLLLCAFLSSPTDPSSLINQLERYASNDKMPDTLFSMAGDLVDRLQNYAKRLYEENQ